jgi:hypothetical protein
MDRRLRGDVGAAGLQLYAQVWGLGLRAPVIVETLQDDAVLFRL